SLDKVGPIARSADDCALVLAAIAGKDDADPSTVDVPLHVDQTAALDGLRVGVIGDGADDDPVVSALRDLGARTVPVEAPEGDHGALIFLHIAVEAAAAFDELTRDGRDDLLVWQDAPAWPNTFRAARLFPAVQHLQARRRRRRLMIEAAAMFEGIDVLVDTRGRRSNLTALTNLTGHPAVTIRSGFRADGTPRATHLWANLHDDGTLLNAAAAVERELGLLDRRPDLG
ncbi:MAG: amidase family protein, partial [Planctomycetota bacterium JB042]